MHMNEPTFALLTCEFLSLFIMVNNQIMSFRIANRHHELTKFELTDMFGWKLVEQPVIPKNFATPFWQKITMLLRPTKYDSCYIIGHYKIRAWVLFLTTILHYIWS